MPKLFLPTFFIFVFFYFCAINLANAAADQIRKCNCDEQHKFVSGIREYLDGCMEKCKGEVGLKSVLNNSMNAEQCFDFGRKLLADFTKCIDTEMGQKESCTKSNNNATTANGAPQLVNAHNFDNSLRKYMQSMWEKKQAMLQNVTTSMQNDNNEGRLPPIVVTMTTMSKCATDCALGKLQSQGCFEQRKCDLQVTDQIVQQTLNKCLHQMSPREKMAEACKCFEQNGFMDVKVFCDKLVALPIPDF